MSLPSQIQAHERSQCGSPRQADAPQFSLRGLLGISATCAVAFATCSAGLHDYLTVAASMVIVFWLGAGLCFAGLVMDSEGDSWLVPAVLAEISGTILSAIALFTATYYSGMYLLVELPRTLAMLASSSAGM